MTTFLTPGGYEAPDETFRSTKIYEHTCTIFEGMSKGSEIDTEDVNQRVLWTGQLTKLYNDMGIAMAYYTPVNRLLITMGCVTQLRRGGGKSGLSIWQINYPPDEKTFLLIGQKNPPRNRSADRQKALENRVDAQENRIARLEMALNRLLLEDASNDTTD